jgi:hypothetical protein
MKKITKISKKIMAKPTIHALFIGINKYDEGRISSLSGCVHDAELMSNWISQQTNLNANSLKIRKLYSKNDWTGARPTRANIIAALKIYATEVQAGDTFFLFYAGHGSTEIAHPAIQSPTGLLSTLVPCDSGIIQPNGQPVFDILSIEIRALLYNIWKNTKARIVFVQDSCHSERASRAYGDKTEAQKEAEKSGEKLLERMVYAHPNRGKIRPLADFDVFTPEVQAQIARNSGGGNANGGQNLTFEQISPLAEHTHLAACAFNQSAYETAGEDGQSGGVFTRTLIELLRLSGGNISFHELESRLKLNINGSFSQTPNLYINSPDATMRYQKFMGSSQLKKEKIYNIIARKANNGSETLNLVLDIGGLQGLPTLRTGESLEIVAIAQPSGTRYKAFIDYVAPNFSTITIPESEKFVYNSENLYYAEVSAKCFIQKNGALKVDIRNDNNATATAICQLLAAELPDTFSHNISNPNINSAYSLAFDSQNNWLLLYENNTFIGIFAATDENLASEAAFPAQKIGNQKIGTIDWFYYNEDGGLQKRPAGWAFLPIPTNEFSDNLDIASYAISSFLSAKGVKPPYNLVAKTAANFSDYINDANIAELSEILTWTEREAAEFSVGGYKSGFSIFNKQDVAICKATDGKSLSDALLIGDYLRQLSAYKQRLLMLNPHPERFSAFDSMNFKVYIQFTEAAAQNFQIVLSPDKQFLPNNLIHIPTNQSNINFSLRFEYSSTSVLSKDNMPPVYAAALFMGIDYAIRPMAFSTPFNLGLAKDFGAGRDIQLPPNFIAKNKGAAAYIKVLIGLKSFDICPLLQEGLPLSDDYGKPIERIEKYGDRASDWLAFTIPLIFNTL